MSLLQMRIFSIKRRSDSLPTEIDQWLRYAEDGKQFEKNFSQLEALDTFMCQILERLQSNVAELMRLIEAIPLDTEKLLEQIQIVEEGIAKAQYIWNYFRTKLDQRFVPQVAQMLLAADLISYDCYTSVRNKANSLGIEHKLGLRDYPLSYLLVNSSPVARRRTSPMTWSRAQKIAALDYDMLPLPIIGIPWDQIGNAWELLSLHHEVSHNLDADLNKPSKELGSKIVRRLLEKGSSQARTSNWESWIGEIIADLLGILLAGPPFVSFLASFMTLPKSVVCSFNANDPHPTPYLRILLNSEFVRAISANGTMSQYIDVLLHKWKKVYSEPSQELVAYTKDFDIVIDTLLSANLEALVNKEGKTHTLHDLFIFNEEDFQHQLTARDHFLSGKEIAWNLPLRHIVGAAYMASEERIEHKTSFDQDFAVKLAEQVKSSIFMRAPAGQLALRTKQSKQYLQDLANAYFDSSFNTNGDGDNQTIW